MNPWSKKAIWMAIAPLVCVSAAAGQALGGNQAVSGAVMFLASSSASQVDPEMQGHGTIIREIDDPHLGDRWVLMRNPAYPAGPGRLVLAAAGLSGVRQSGAEGSSPAPALPVIHTGDRLIVEENTALVAARLEAVALGPASPGSLLKVRLAIGGGVVRAVALSPGRAAFAPEAGGRP